MQQQAHKPQDRHAMWENSEDIRKLVKDDLYEWGSAQRGGMPNLGYPRESYPLTMHDPKPATMRYDVDKVQAITDTMTLWRMGVAEASPEVKKEVRRYIRVIKRYFIGQGAVESMARAEGVTRRHFHRLLREAMRQFWILHY